MDQRTPSDSACLQEQSAFRHKAARLQFLQSVFQGIGGALLFGMVSSLVLSGGLAVALPVWALVAIPAAGIVSIFIGTRCGIESQLLSQSLGAKLMGNAVKPTIAPETQPSQEKPKTLPPGMTGIAESREADGEKQDRPTTSVHSIAALDRMSMASPSQEIH